MRLLHLISSHGRNGAIIQAVRFGRLLVERGHTVFAAVIPGGWAEQELRGVIETIPTNFDRTAAEFTRLGDFCRERGVQATHSFVTRAHNFGWRLERRTGVPHIALAQSHHPEVHWLFQRRVLTVAEDMRRTQLRWYFRRPHQVALLHNFVDTARFAPVPRDDAKRRELFGAAPGEILLVCVAEMVPRKGQLELIRALPEIRRQFPAVRAVFLGREGLRPEYVKRVHAETERLGLGAHVFFGGFREDVPDILPHCDVAVMPSHADPFALGALEAMSCGLPLVATRVGGFPEMVTEGGNGALAKPRHPASLAEAILSVIRDEPRRRAMGEAARARIERDFSPPVCGARFESIARTWGIA